MTGTSYIVDGPSQLHHDWSTLVKSRQIPVGGFIGGPSLSSQGFDEKLARSWGVHRLWWDWQRQRWERTAGPWLLRASPCSDTFSATPNIRAQLQEPNTGWLVFVFSPLPAPSLVAQHLCFLLQKWNTDCSPFVFHLHPPPHPFLFSFFYFYFLPFFFSLSFFVCNISIWCLQFGRTLDYNTLLSSL